MPTYLYWGDDDFRLQQAIKSLQNKVLDPTWLSFNFDKIEGSNQDTAQLIQGLNQLMTPPLGNGDRLVWLINPPLTASAEDFITELERTLPQLPQQSHLLVTLNQKPDGRSKVFKFIQQHADITEFQNTPSWKTNDLLKDIKASAKELQLELHDDIASYLLEAVGNDTRQLYQALKKIQLFTAQTDAKTFALKQIQDLIPNTARNSLELSNFLRQGDTHQALTATQDLIQQNEPALKIVATLIRQFRTWTWVKIMQENGERDDRVVAKAADIRNPKRLYFLRKDIQQLSATQLKQCLKMLRELELELKQGQDSASSLHTKIIQLSLTCQSNRV